MCDPVVPVFVVFLTVACHCLPMAPVFPRLLVVFTCDLARPLSVASPPLQEEEIVAPLGHPELQSVFQQNFLRVQPHFFQQGGTGGSPPPCPFLQRPCIKLSPPVLRLGGRPDGSYSGGFSGLSMILLRSKQLQVFGLPRPASALSRPICSSCTVHTSRRSSM